MATVSRQLNNKDINDITRNVMNALDKNRNSVSFIDMTAVRANGDISLNDEHLYNNIRSGQSLAIIMAGGIGSSITGGLSILPHGEKQVCAEQQRKIANELQVKIAQRDQEIKKLDMELETVSMHRKYLGSIVFLVVLVIVGYFVWTKWLKKKFGGGDAGGDTGGDD